jgi:hypothetical protein
MSLLDDDTDGGRGGVLIFREPSTRYGKRNRCAYQSWV